LLSDKELGPHIRDKHDYYYHLSKGAELKFRCRFNKNKLIFRKFSKFEIYNGVIVIIVQHASHKNKSYKERVIVRNKDGLLLHCSTKKLRDDSVVYIAKALQNVELEGRKALEYTIKLSQCDDHNVPYWVRSPEKGIKKAHEIPHRREEPFYRRFLTWRTDVAVPTGELSLS